MVDVSIDVAEPRQRWGAVLAVLRTITSAIGFVMLGAVVVLALWPRSWLPHTPGSVSPADRFVPPAWVSGGSTEHLLGTDVLGRDIFTELVAGARATLIIVVLAAALSALIGVLAGLAAGHFGGWVDTVLMRFVDVQLALPVLIVIIAVVAIYGPSTLNLVLVLAAASWPPYARLVRGAVLTLRDREFVEAAWASGAGHWSVIWRHYLPNVATSIIVLLTFEFARLILVEASLSFLGLGIQPPTSSWGRMIAEARQYLHEAWWASAIPGALIVLTVIAFNVVGDQLRDRLDPTARRPTRWRRRPSSPRPEEAS